MTLNIYILPRDDPTGRGGASPPRKRSNEPEYLLNRRVPNLEVQIEGQKGCGNFEARLAWQNDLISVGYKGPAPVQLFDPTEDCPTTFPLAPIKPRSRPELEPRVIRQRRQEDTAPAPASKKSSHSVDLLGQPYSILTVDHMHHSFARDVKRMAEFALGTE